MLFVCGGLLFKFFLMDIKKKNKHIHLSNNSLFDFAFGVFIFNISCWESTIICIADNAYIYIYIYPHNLRLIINTANRFYCTKTAKRTFIFFTFFAL